MGDTEPVLRLSKRANDFSTLPRCIAIAAATFSGTLCASRRANALLAGALSELRRRRTGLLCWGFLPFCSQRSSSGSSIVEPLPISKHTRRSDLPMPRSSRSMALRSSEGVIAPVPLVSRSPKNSRTSWNFRPSRRVVLSSIASSSASAAVFRRPTGLDERERERDREGDRDRERDVSRESNRPRLAAVSCWYSRLAATRRRGLRRDSGLLRPGLRPLRCAAAPPAAAPLLAAAAAATAVSLSLRGERAPPVRW